MRVLVTGGAGFIGSHTADRLIDEGHEVIVVDGLRPPVHRDGKPLYLAEGAEFHEGDVRDPDLMRGLLRRVDAVYHFAAYQDYLTDFSTFFDVNVTSTALIYEIAVAERLDLAKVIVASSQAVMGEGLYRCPEHGEQTPGMRSDAQLREGRWDIGCPVCQGPMEVQHTPERVAKPQNPYAMSKYGQEMIALNLGRRYGIPSVAIRYSIVQGPRQSVYNAYSGACRVFSLAYKLGRAPVVFEDGQALRDYVNIFDAVDANLLVLENPEADYAVFNLGGGTGYATLDFARIVKRQYGSGDEPRLTNEYRIGDTRKIISDISALKALGWQPKRTPETSVAEYAAWLDGLDGLDGILEEALEKMRLSGVLKQAGA